MKYIKFFSELRAQDTNLVGGKNASLGEMISQLSTQKIRIPNGFAVTTQAYWYLIQENRIMEKLRSILQQLKDPTDLKRLKSVSNNARRLIEKCFVPSDLENEIIESYKKLSNYYNQEDCDVAVRSSASAEDSPTASFAGQQETFLNVKGKKNLIQCYKKCLSSLFTQRAIIYRIEHGFNHFEVSISVGIQKMIRSDNASAGVAFTLDTETGFKDVIFINSSYGLGESVVQGIITPDSFYVHKPTLDKGYKPILKKELGTKQTKIIYSNYKNTKIVNVEKSLQNKFSLNDDEILELAKMSLTIENYYSKISSKWTPMDIEWAKDGIDKKIYIVQARYETIHANQDKLTTKLTKYKLKETNKEKLKKLLIINGQSIGQKIASGKAKIVMEVDQINKIEDGDIIVTTMTNPDWVPAMKKSAGIVTDKGGRTCHAAIVSRELGIPAIIGTGNGTKLIKNKSEITIDCSEGEIGNIYKTKIPFDIETIAIDKLKKPKVSVMINTGNPDTAFKQSFLPVDGVGLARIEFIISNKIKIHPMALIKFDQIKDKKIKKQIEEITNPYNDKINFFVDKLAQEAGTIAAAFYPKPVIIRLSDFKSNEYRNLIGGSYFEPIEENPMIGLRGASRYYSNIYKDAFELECLAMKKIREIMGLTNVKIMIPFVRTLEEAEIVLAIMQRFGLERKKNNLEIIMMCEVPSNALLVEEFCKYFDGFSIGSNDLTQLTLAIDRDSSLLSNLFDERDIAVKKMLKMAIGNAKKSNKPIGICGEAPSNYPELTKFLIDSGITSISLNPDYVIQFFLHL